MAEEVKVEGNPESLTAPTRPRKKRKWDQPAESVISALASASASGLMPFNSTGALGGITLPGMLPSLGAVYSSVPITASPQISLPFATVQQSAAAIIQKINQDLAAKGVLPPNKIQDEVIAREIVINDAEPGVRYKLTKRQTQEQIQSKTGAVVITRGKYKPPNGPPDLEKPLYLHISAGAHLKETAERVRAVEQAAAIVDEMLKQGRQGLGPSSAGQLGTNSPLSAVVFADFEVDSPIDLITRIRGPNDQYINHIMHETGATVLLKGGACESSCSDEIPQPLHLLISAENTKALEDARSLTEHLLETIRSEMVGARPPYFPPPVSYNLQQLPQVTNSLEPGNASFLQPSGISVAVHSTNASPADFNSGVGSYKLYGAVPPPKQLLDSDLGASQSEIVSSLERSLVSNTSLGVAPVSSPLSTVASSLPIGYTSPLKQTSVQQTYGVYPQASRGSESYPSYSAYSGLYPQASPLQQVALALQRPVSSPLSSSSVSPESITNPLNSSAQRLAEKQERQRRKFQEGPTLKCDPHTYQALIAKQSKQLGLVEAAPSKLMLTPRSVFASSSGSVRPHPSSSMPPPSIAPLPPRSQSISHQPGEPYTASRSTFVDPVPILSKLPEPENTGIKLVEYGEDEDEDNEGDCGRIEPNVFETAANPYANGKPFWAV